MSKINWDEYPSGTYFTCVLNDDTCMGRIHKCEEEVFLLQNDHEGVMPNDRETMEFKYSWCLGIGTQHEIQENQVENLKLSKDKNFVLVKTVDRAILKAPKTGALYYKEIILNDRRKVGSVHLSPFANCQTMTMPSAYRLNRYSTSQLIAIYSAMSKQKRVLIVDIEDRHVKSILPRKKDLYLYKTRYNNTTGSNMTIAAIKLKEMVVHLKKKLESIK